MNAINTLLDGMKSSPAPEQVPTAQGQEVWVKERTQVLFADRANHVHRRTDKVFAALMGGQFLFGIVAALLIAPRTWIGAESQTHLHVWAAVVLGALFSGLPVLLTFARPGWVGTRHVVAVGQALTTALLVHLTGGRIETHFHVFGSLAVLAFYRDANVLLTYTVVTAADHFGRGLLYPQSIYGVMGGAEWRWLEHAAWVVFEDVFLFFSCRWTQQEMRDGAERQARLESANTMLIDPLRDSAQLLALSAVNLNTSTTDQRQTITRQAAALQETQVTAQEIKQTSMLAAQKAEAVLKVAERADELSRTGEEAIEHSLDGLQEIRSRVAEISQKISQLSDRTKQIGGITQTVKDLADQSNMLALNAAIEAVRSGEHGKGFAVVAREIRSLADQSIKATERVREILEDISGAIREAVEITDKGAQKMESGLVQVKTSGESLRELSMIVRDNSSAVRQIAAAVNQQNAGITQIFTAVTDLSRMMDDTVTRLDATGQAAGMLEEVSARVSSVVKQYRPS